MKMKMYSVFDSKLAVFSFPRSGLRDAAIIREFSDAVNNVSEPNNQWAKHPEDFSVFYLGEFDDELGTFDSHQPKCLVTASAVKEVFPKLEVVNPKPATQ